MEEKVQSAIIMYTPKDLKNIFKCGQQQAYELMHTKGFPSIQIGRKLVVEDTALRKWLETNKGRTIIKFTY